MLIEQESANKTWVNVYGMNFYITWKNKQEGYDQHGVKWLNKENPTCSNELIIEMCKSTYNTVNIVLNALNKK